MVHLRVGWMRIVTGALPCPLYTHAQAGYRNGHEHDSASTDDLRA